MPKVQCPNCKKICHKTTDAYDPDIRANGAMVELLEPWKSWGWGKFGDYRNGGSEIMASDMQCPCCEAPLAPAGRLQVVRDIKQEIKKEDSPVEKETDSEMPEKLLFRCPKCGKEYNHQSSLSRHMKTHVRKGKNA